MVQHRQEWGNSSQIKVTGHILQQKSSCPVPSVRGCSAHRRRHPRGSCAKTVIISGECSGWLPSWSWIEHLPHLKSRHGGVRCWTVEWDRNWPIDPLLLLISSWTQCLVQHDSIDLLTFSSVSCGSVPLSVVDKKHRMQLIRILLVTSMPPFQSEPHLGWPTNCYCW